MHSKKLASNSYRLHQTLTVNLPRAEHQIIQVPNGQDA